MADEEVLCKHEMPVAWCSLCNGSAARTKAEDADRFRGRYHDQRKVDRDPGLAMRSRYHSYCYVCSEDIEVGQWIVPSPPGGRYKWIHQGCADED